MSSLGYNVQYPPHILWSDVQFVKFFLALSLSYDIYNQERKIAHLASHDFLACAQWVASWLGPHWLVEILEKIENENPKDAAVSFRYVNSQDGRPGQTFFKGRFSEFSKFDMEESPYFQRYTKRRHLLPAYFYAKEVYGEAIPALSEEGELRILFPGLVEIGNADHSDISLLGQYNDRALESLLIKLSNYTNLELMAMMAKYEE